MSLKHRELEFQVLFARRARINRASQSRALGRREASRLETSSLTRMIGRPAVPLVVSPKVKFKHLRSFFCRRLELGHHRRSLCVLAKHGVAAEDARPFHFVVWRDLYFHANDTGEIQVTGKFGIFRLCGYFDLSGWILRRRLCGNLPTSRKYPNKCKKQKQGPKRPGASRLVFAHGRHGFPPCTSQNASWRPKRWDRIRNCLTP